MNEIETKVIFSFLEFSQQFMNNLKKKSIKLDLIDQILTYDKFSGL